MSIPVPPSPAMSPKVRDLIYGVLGWLGLLLFLAFTGYAALPNATPPEWLLVANAVTNGANVAFFMAKNNITDY